MTRFSLSMFAAATTCLAVPFAAQSTTRISVGTSGAQGDGDSYSPSISADANRIVFQSDASTLVAGDTNGATDVFLRDLAAQTTTRVSLGLLGAQPDGECQYPRLSADGRFVAFDSTATNLVAGDTNGCWDAFVRDLANAITERVSVDSSGAEANDVSTSPAISGDGRYVAFSSYATNLVSGDTNGVEDVFVRDRAMGITTRVSVDRSGAQGDQPSRFPTISRDGRFVCFDSNATHLVAHDTNGVIDTFVHDRVTGRVVRVNLSSSGAQSTGGSAYSVISGNGRFVVFSSAAADLVGGDLNGNWDVFVRDLVQRTTTIASVTSTGVQGDSASTIAAISNDGRYVAFKSVSSNLAPNDHNASYDIFVRDLANGTTTCASVNALGRIGNGDSGSPAISDGGKLVSYFSASNNLVSGDTNDADDVFVRDL